jgi:GTP-binding protein Era
MTAAPHKAGFVALVGRPNVGKSTLLNALLGRKLAIVTPKPQTTRTRILGIVTQADAQLLFIDTPGLHRPRNLLGERMVRTAEVAQADADVTLWVVDAALGVSAEDEAIARAMSARGRPLVVGVNKIDLVKRGSLLEKAHALGILLPGHDVVPISARTGENLGELLTTLKSHLPASPALYPGDAETDLPERFFAAEMIREQLVLLTHEEVPYQCAVRVDSFIERDGRDLLVIEATILVARSSQRAIVIGEKGARLKAIGQQARLELEKFFGVRVYLQLFVKLDARWFTKAGTLAELGL